MEGDLSLPGFWALSARSRSSMQPKDRLLEMAFLYVQSLWFSVPPENARSRRCGAYILGFLCKSEYDGVRIHLANRYEHEYSDTNGSIYERSSVGISRGFNSGRPLRCKSIRAWSVQWLDILRFLVI
jgi:hypothetical protein